MQSMAVCTSALGVREEVPRVDPVPDSERSEGRSSCTRPDSARPEPVLELCGADPRVDASVSVR